jgi:hypothetical protein
MPFPQILVPQIREVGVQVDLRNPKIKFYTFSAPAAGAGAGTGPSSSVIIQTVPVNRAWQVQWVQLGSGTGKAFIASAVAGSRQLRLLYDDASTIKTKGFPAGSTFAANAQADSLLWARSPILNIISGTPDVLGFGPIDSWPILNGGYSIRALAFRGDPTAGTGDQIGAGEICVEEYFQRAITDFG